MAGLQRSVVSFRRQGSSGLVWDDKVIQAELLKQATAAAAQPEESSSGAGDISGSKAQSEIVQDQTVTGSPRPAGSMERSRSGGSGGRGYRTGRVSPAFEPPSPKVSACGLCAAFGRQQEKAARGSNRPPRHGSSAGKRIM